MKKLKLFIMMVGLSTFLLVGCSKDSELERLTDGTVRGEGGAAGSINYAARVYIQNSSFNPAELMVVVSGTVLWINNDNMVHTVTANDGSFDSGDLQSGASFSYTFNVNGPHYYRCKYHPEMTGLVKAVTK